VDVLHLNLHKTFSTPHGAVGRAPGPVLTREPLAKYLPTPVVRQEPDGRYRLVAPQASIGRVGGFAGNFGVLLRAYCYIRTLGSDGLRRLANRLCSAQLSARPSPRCPHPPV
jgi:glycine dehydrogenase subunit 2